MREQHSRAVTLLLRQQPPPQTSFRKDTTSAHTRARVDSTQDAATAAKGGVGWAAAHPEFERRSGNVEKALNAHHVELVGPWQIFLQPTTKERANDTTRHETHGVRRSSTRQTIDADEISREMAAMQEQGQAGSKEGRRKGPLAKWNGT